MISDAQHSRLTFPMDASNAENGHTVSYSPNMSQARLVGLALVDECVGRLVGELLGESVARHSGGPSVLNSVKLKEQRC